MATADPIASTPPPERPVVTKPIASWALIAACGAAFAAAWHFSRGLDAATLVCCGAKDRDLILHSRQWWRLASAGFLHADLLHLAVNLFALWNLGSLIEGLWGTRRFVIIYAAALVCGNLASLATTVTVSVGASGAIFGLFGALVVFAVRHRRLLLPKARNRLLVHLAIVLGVNVALGITVPFIDNAAHAGGFVAGIAAALVLRPVRVLGESGGPADLLVRLAAAAAMVGMAGSLAMAVRHARMSEWMRVIGGELEPHRLDGDLTLSVPKGWRYHPPSESYRFHVFVQPDVAFIVTRLVPPKEGADVASAAANIRRLYQEQQIELIASREITVGSATGIELLSRRKLDTHVERNRTVLLPTPLGRIAYVSFNCIESRYKFLEVLFDRVLHSVRVGPTPRVATGDDRLWEKVAEDPRDPDAAVALAARYAREGRAEQAERILLATLELHPSHAESHNQLALLYTTARPPHRRPDEAVRRAQKAISLQPDMPRYQGTLALAYEAAGDRGRALAAARRAAALAPDDATYADLVNRLSR